MKRILHLLVLVITISTTAISQETSTRSVFEKKIYLYDGSQKILKKIKLEKPIFSENYFHNNDEKILASEVQYYTDGRAFYANLRHKGGVFVEREFNGRISLYSKEVLTASIFNNVTTFSEKTVHYFNINDEPLKKVKYRPILDIVKDSQSSMRFMDLYRKKRMTSVLMGVTSVLLFAGSIVSIAIRDDRNNDLDTDVDHTIEYAGMGLGVVGMIASWSIGSKKDRLVLDAIYAY